MPKWTDDQQHAIDARGGTLLVSAAAGSGKTAVLVERVIKKLTDEHNPIGVRDLLIVTFTNAAAAQMKERISAAIGKRILLEPGNRHLRRQQMLLPLANICTIDSFCINLVRENFHALNVTPDFRLLDEEKTSMLSSEAVNTVIARLYEENLPSFVRLCKLISDSRDDSLLAKVILTLYSVSQAYPFPESRLSALEQAFNSPLPIKQSLWGSEIINYAQKQLSYFDCCASCALDALAGDPELCEKYGEAFEQCRVIIDRLSKSLSEKEWNDIGEAFVSSLDDFVPFKPIRGYTGNNKERCAALRKVIKDGIEGLCDLFAVSEAEYLSDTTQLAPVVSQLVRAVTLFAEEYDRLKKEENGADFSDTLHLALQLLVKQNESGLPERTELAKELSEEYDEILVDEYQDVNLAQEWIFNALSKGESNLFMVGDVKQSIYRFRQAMPELFLARRDELPQFSGTCPATVSLGKNFRSRKGITEIIDFIFSQAMSREAGGLDYIEAEYLHYGAAYPEHNGADTEFYLIEASSGELAYSQAVFAADYIENAIKSGMTVQDGESTRTVTYKDFCILLRSVSKNGKAFTDEFESRGIPYFSDTGDNFFDSPEIGFMISLLKVIDNPVDDIAILTVMLSPVFGFTSDDMALLRAHCREGSLYRCVSHAASEGDAKCVAFLKRLELLRMTAATVGPGELVRRLIDETGYGSIAMSMKDSDRRKANLHRLIDCANKYEANSNAGLSGFIRYTENLSTLSGLSNSDSVSENADIVRIMTIHKSKGLEFPICLLACTESKYHDVNTSTVSIARDCGIGIRNCDESGLRKFDTVNSIAVKIENEREEHSEEMRVLYVALTRAKERLVITAGCTNAKNLLMSASTLIDDTQVLNPNGVSASKSYAKILSAALLRHPDAHALRLACFADNSIVRPCASPLKAEIIKTDSSEQYKFLRECDTPRADGELVHEIKSRLEYKYPFASLNNVLSKRIASKLDAGEFSGAYFASAAPAFMSRGELTPAQRGTAIHRFMQFADYSQARISVQAELERLQEQGILTEKEAQAADTAKLSRFFAGELAQRMTASQRLYKEYAFTVSLPVGELYDSVDECAQAERVMIEGVADCAFVENGSLVIVDYKTDRNVTEQELAERYAPQLRMYRRCLPEVLCMPVSQTLIYSFELGRAIEVN